MHPFAHTDPRGGHNRINVDKDFFKKWSCKMAYVLGYIFADGHIQDVQKSTRTCHISITSKDVSILESIKRVLNSNHKLQVRPPMLHIFPGGRKYITHETFRLRIGCKSMYNDLLGLGVIPRKSLTISFPQIPINYLSYFVRGYFDGDGCIYFVKGKYPIMIFTSGSIKFLEGLSDILASSLNIPNKRTYFSHSKTPNPCYQLKYSTTQSKRILEFIYKGLHKAPYLGRKYFKYEKYLSLDTK